MNTRIKAGRPIRKVKDKTDKYLFILGVSLGSIYTGVILYLGILHFIGWI